MPLAKGRNNFFSEISASPCRLSGQKMLKDHVEKRGAQSGPVELVSKRWSLNHLLQLASPFPHQCWTQLVQALRGLFIWHPDEISREA